MRGVREDLPLRGGARTPPARVARGGSHSSGSRSAFRAAGPAQGLASGSRCLPRSRPDPGGSVQLMCLCGPFNSVGMPNSCPECGASVEFSSRNRVVLEGSCESCGGSFTVLGGSGTAAVGEPAEAGGGGAPSSRGETVWRGPTPTCATCGGTLYYQPSRDGIESVCVGCGRTSVFRAEGSIGRDPRGSRDRGSPGRDASDRMEAGPPRGRPCRECGGPLRFSTGPDGAITGECGSCGNRFTLPPRDNFGGGRRAGPPGRFSRGPPRYGRGPPRNSYRRPSGGRFDRRGSRDDNDDDEPPRRRRRSE